VVTTRLFDANASGEVLSKYECRILDETPEKVEEVGDVSHRPNG